MKYTFSQHLCWVLLLCAFSLGRSEDEPVSRLPTTVARTTRQRRLEELKNTIKKSIDEKTTIPFTPDEASSTTSFNILWKDVKNRNRSIEHLSGNTVPVVGTTESSTKKQPKAKPGAPNLISAMKMVTNMNDQDILSPTGWALASMTKPPKRSTTLPTKPINNYWSTRFQKTTTPIPIISEIQLTNEKNNLENTTEKFPDIPANNLINVTKIEDKNENITLIDQSTTSMTRPTNSTIKPYKENNKTTAQPSIGNDIPDDLSIIKNNFTTPIPYFLTEKIKNDTKPTEIPNMKFNGTETVTVTESTTQPTHTTEAIQKPIVNYIEEITTQFDKNESGSTTSIPIFNNTIKVITNKELNHTNEIFKSNIQTSSTESSKINEIKTKNLEDKDNTQNLKIPKDLLERNNQHSQDLKIPKITIEKNEKDSQELKIPKLTIEKNEYNSQELNTLNITVEKDDKNSQEFKIPEITIKKDDKNSQDLNIPAITIKKDEDNSPDLNIPTITIKKDEDNSPDLKTPGVTIKKDEKNLQGLEIPAITIKKDEDNLPDLKTPGVTIKKDEKNLQGLEIPAVTIKKDEDNSQGLKIPEITVEKNINDSKGSKIPEITVEKNENDSQDVKIPEIAPVEKENETSKNMKIPEMALDKEKDNSHDLENPKLDIEKDQELEIPKVDEQKKENSQDLEIPTEVETNKENSQDSEIPKINVEKDKDTQDLKIIKDLVEKSENFTIPKDSIESPIDVQEKDNTIKIPTTEPEIKETTEVNFSSTKNLNVSEHENKTESTIYHEHDDDDDSVMYNSTFHEKKPGYDDEDDIHKDLDGMVTTVLSEEILNETTTYETTTVTKTTQSEEDVTNVDNDRSNIDDDTIYDNMVPMNVKLTIHASYKQMCAKKEALRDAIVKLFKSVFRDVDRKQIIILNLGEMECPSNLDGELVPVKIFFTDAQGQYDNTLTDTFVSLVRGNHLDFIYQISKIEKEHETFVEPSMLGGTVIAAIVISSIAGVCLLFLTILLVIMRKRQKGFNYGQRCTPVSLDDYSLDNISVYNSVRRKAIRASKRSYGNPAFDDPVALTSPLNFAGLSNMVTDKAKIEEEFSRVPVITVKPDELPLGAETKNRYANVIPLPETRVQLMKTNSSNVLDQFINANYVKGSKSVEKFYIACQAPMANTVADFWQMVWEQQSKIIIMLTDLHENGVEKCADYLPPSEVLDCHRVFGDLQVTLKKREVREKYIISSLQLRNLENNLWREVTHMWFASWPSRGVPDDLSSLIAFLIEARSYAKSGPPVVVHCSPGTGRTGTVIAIDIAIRDFETDRIVDIPKTVYSIRRDRAGAVQTSEQYKLIYQVIHFYATKLTGGVLDSI